MRFIRGCMLVAALVAAWPLAAQSPPSGDPHAIMWGLGVTRLGFDPAAAQEQGVGKQAFGLQATTGVVLWRVLAVSLDGEVPLVSDKRKFTDSTSDGLKESDVTAWAGSAAVGLRTPFLPGGDGPGLSAGVDLGRSWIGGYRHIAGCINCNTEDLTIDGGSFVEPRVTFTTKGQVEITVSYRAHVGSDVRNRLLLGFGGRVRF